MRISPHDIRQQQFTVRMFRGTDRQEVDSFLEDVADDYETLLKEHQLLKEQLAAMEDRQRGVLDRERSLNETLVTTQRLVEEMKLAAKRGRTSSCARPSCAAKGGGGGPQRGSQAPREVQALRRLRRQAAEEVASTLERYQRLLHAEAEDDPGEPS
jgi:cell division initiation protein